MTAQSREILTYKGETVGMAAEPLARMIRRKKIKFLLRSSDCWRSYIGYWEIKDDQLFLVDIDAYDDDGKKVKVSDLFNGQTEVFADWVSEELCIPQGKLLKYSHGGFSSIYERDLLLKFEKGRLIDERVVENSISNDTKPI
jgi:hypothetical protein